MKLIHAVLYFASNTLNLRKTKLIKLLYFLDFIHYRDIGRSVTGLDYHAWPRGPVPNEFYDELDRPDSDLREFLQITPETIQNNRALKINSKGEFNPDYFSRRELEILEQLSKQYFRSNAADMVEATHLENQPWHFVYETKGRRQQLIPYRLAIRLQDEEEVLELAKETVEMKNNKYL